KQFLAQMYGNTPNYWDPKLKGIDTGCVWGGTLTAIDLDHLASANEIIRLPPTDQGLKIKTLSVAGYDHPMRM
ncbi:MAG: hypothetical protein EBV36_04855, partial [Burkholderiaceae bacterium]|nr:hypothetical protein [Burkholderiaceae bacterium]